MASMMAEAEVELPRPGQCVDDLCGHFVEHGLSVTKDGPRRRIAFTWGLGTLHAATGTVRMRAEADDVASLCQIRASLSSHLVEFAGTSRAPEIVWTGDASNLTVPPNFREVTVSRVVDLSARMRRITLSGERLDRFDAHHLHLKLLIPPTGIEPEWPILGRNGLLTWPESAGRPAMRTYTIRRVDAEAGEIDVDMVLHPGHGGPGSVFASRAEPGDQIGIIGPGGRNVEPAEWYLLAGDETALPAIARILAQLPRAARGTALIEIGGPAGRQDLSGPPGMDVRWLDRGGAEPGTTTLLSDAVLFTDIPAGVEAFAWAGAEFSTFKTLRRHWRQTCDLARDRHLCVSYWRRGQPEGRRAPAERE